MPHPHQMEVRSAKTPSARVFPSIVDCTSFNFYTVHVYKINILSSLNKATF